MPPRLTEMNVISTLLIPSLVDDEVNWLVLPKAFYLVINNRVETRKTAWSLKYTAFINDAFDADESGGHTAKTL